MLYPPSPYSLKEEIYWIWKNFFPRRYDTGILSPLGSDFYLNKGIIKYRIGFTGDVMGIGRKRLAVSPELKMFFTDCDFLVMNMESIITEKYYPGSQANSISLLDSISELFPVRRIFFSLANNHAGDFGTSEFNKSVNAIEKTGFNYFGTREKPSIGFNEKIGITGITFWCNRESPFINYSSSMNDFSLCPGNEPASEYMILYPHWGYELELFPRKDIIKTGINLLQYFNAIVGHHSHVPQPVYSQVNRVFAPSLGNFCFPFNWRNYTSGTVLILSIGENNRGELVTVSGIQRKIQISSDKRNVYVSIV